MEISIVGSVRANGPRALAVLVATVAVALPVAASGPVWLRGPAVGLTELFVAGRPRPGLAVPLAAALLVLARGLAGGRRLAYHLLVAALLTGLVVPVLTGPAPTGYLVLRSVVVLAVLGGLVAVRGDLPVRPHPRQLRAAAQFGLVGLLAAVAHGSWLVGVAGDSPARSARLALAPVGTGGVLGLLAIAALAVVLAPVPAPEPGTAGERAWVLALAAHPEADSLAPFATRPDRSYVFSPDGRSAIGYRVLWGTALVGGDPVGERDSAGAAIAAFLDACWRNGWRPAVLGASDPMVDWWRAHGLRRRVVFGDEAVLDVATFSLRCRRMRNVRQAVQRTRNAGVTVHIGQPDPERLTRLEPVLRNWLRGCPERGFAMNLGWLLDPRPDCVVAIARDRAGVPQAFARFASCAAGRVLTLDVAPRRTDAPNGVVERLIVDVVEYGRTRGVAEVSLNFAGFRSVYAGSGPGARTAAALVHLLDRWIELGPLYRFTAKFHPRWRRRSVLMRSWLDLARVGTAALYAEFGRTRTAAAAVDGWLPVPTPQAPR
jgi:lysyl-tRNA synthetase class 2